MEPYATALGDAVEAAIAGWVVRSVERVLREAGHEVDQALLDRAAEAGRQATAGVMTRLRPLLEQDIDDQRTTPLAIVRGAVRFPTAVLREAGVPPVQRDEFAARAFPDDLYDLTPASLADVDPSLQEHAIAWGAAKAHTHFRRHQ